MYKRQPKGRVNYEPSSLQADSPRETPNGFKSFAQADDGQKGRIRAESFADHYSQARLFYRSQTDIEQAHMAAALVFELSKVQTEAVRERVVGHLVNIDPSLAQRVADGLGLSPLPPAPAPAAPVTDMKPSPALQIVGKMKAILNGRAVGILVDDGSDGAAVDGLRKAVEQAGAKAVSYTHLADQLKVSGKKPYIVPYGGSNELGAIAFIAALEELESQAKSEPFSHIVFASSSGGTQAGLMVGKDVYKRQA